MCGTKKIQASYELAEGLTKSCGCQQSALSSKKRLKPDMLRAKRHIFNICKGRSRRNHHNQFNIPFDDFVKMILSPCHYCGEVGSNSYSDPESQANRMKLGVVKNFRYNGLDRLDNSLDYTIENSVTCCKVCNQAKHMLGVDEFLAWIDRIYEFQHRQVKERFRTL